MDAIKAVNASNIIKQASEGKKTQNVDFEEFLINSLEKVNSDQINAQEMTEDLALGKVDNLHDVMIVSQKAELSLSFAVEVRNKILEAYKEVMRIQM